MKEPDILAALKPVVKAFTEVGVAYQIGGSVASSAYGSARATLDVDLVARLRDEQVRPLAGLLKDAYYVDEEMIRDAIATRSSFNLIHLESMHKVDVFVLKERPYDLQAFERARTDTLAEDDPTPFRLASPEDVILNKLEWYRKGDHVSDRQWTDVLGVIKVQGYALDLAYLRYWASELGVSDLLEEALTQAGLRAR